jgi:hypothetical protein
MALTKLIREVQSDPSVKNLGELAEWTSPLSEQAPTSVPSAPKGLLEEMATELAGHLQTGRRRLGRDLTAAEQKDLAEAYLQSKTAKSTGLTETELSKLSPGEFTQRFGEAQVARAGGNSPFWRSRARAAGISESAVVPGAAAVPGPDIAAMAAEMNKLPPQSVERDEAWRSLRDAYARTESFGGRRLDQS